MGSTSRAKDPSIARRSVLLFLAGALLWGPACTSSNDPGSPAASATTSPSERPSSDDHTPGAPGSEPDSASTPPPSTEARVEDKGGRRTVSGKAPAYVEIAEAKVRSATDGLLLAVKLSGPPPPAATRGRTRVGFTLTDGARRFVFEAELGPQGWTPRASSPEGSPDEFPGTLEVSGPVIEMTVDWTYLEGMTRFDWIASAAWSDPDTGAYAFDSAPERGPAHFPE